MYEASGNGRRHLETKEGMNYLKSNITHYYTVSNALHPGESIEVKVIAAP